MLLLSAEQIDELRFDLDSQSGFRISSIAVDFDAFDFARTGESLVDRAVAYSMPNGDRLVGIGTAWSASASGQSRFSDIREKLLAVGRPELKAFVGFAFLPDTSDSEVWQGYPPAEVFLPRIGMEQTEDGTRLTVIVPEKDATGPTLDLLASLRRPEQIRVADLGDHSIESVPPVSEWAASVVGAVEAIRRGELDKVVLARSVVVRSTELVEILRVFRELVRTYPLCYTFAWKSGDAVFMGASPELFVEVSGGRFRSNPLAGTAPRGEGRDEDEQLARQLLAASKQRSEHALVVDDLAKRLAPLVLEMSVPGAPSLKQLATVQHLSTEIEGRLADGLGLLDVVEAAHPTPAVGGVERDTAVRYIHDHESIDRGWYTGGVGWVNGKGDGAVCLGLRCGLIRGHTTRVFAGAGIVAESQPEEELAETRLKLKPLMDLLTAN